MGWAELNIKVIFVSSMYTFQNEKNSIQIICSLFHARNNCLQKLNSLKNVLVRFTQESLK